MERDHFVHGFARRLTMLMKQANLTSSTSKAGVKISTLAQISGCSHQMARRYVLGEALPDINITYKIAKWLKVSPGWLLFGEETEIPNNITQNNLIQIEPDLLEYILTKSALLFHLTQDTKELVHFIIDIIHDAIHIDADKKEIMKIVDISVNSAMRFNGIKDDRKTQVS